MRASAESSLRPLANVSNTSKRCVPSGSVENVARLAKVVDNSSATTGSMTSSTTLNSTDAANAQNDAETIERPGCTV
eukprot:5241542-Pleurochrysis_carterae.AAC.1